MLGYTGWYSRKVTREILFFTPFMQVLVIGPVVYFYIKSLLSPTFKFHKKDWWHFVPGILYFGYSCIVFITDKLILDEFYFYSDFRDKDLKAWYQVAGLISMFSYLILSLQKYIAYKKAIFETVSYADSVLFKWIQNFLLAFLALLILRVLFFIINPQWEEFGSQFWYFISFSLVFFYISINGYAHAVIANTFVIEKDDDPVLFLEDDKTNSTSIDVDFWKNQIQTLIKEEKLYTNPKLTLSEVAKLLDTNTKTISTTINSGFNKNFNDYINDFRIEAVKAKIQKNEHLKSTLLGIALDCGFNSKATFNRAFKKSTSLTPKDFINSFK